MAERSTWACLGYVLGVSEKESAQQGRGGTVLGWVLALPWLVSLGLVGVWMHLFSMEWSGTWVLLLLATSMPVGGVFGRWARGAGTLGLIALAVWGWTVPFHEYASQVATLHARVQRDGPDALRERDLLALYGLNGVVGAAGLAVGFPEVARETWALAVLTESDRSHTSDFAMRSPRIRGAVADMVSVDLAEPSGDEVGLSPRRLSWGGSYGGSESTRVALALDGPSTLSGTAYRYGERWRLDLVATLRVRYPAGWSQEVGRVGGVPVVVDEGLFWALQQRGWLHPYEASWRWSLWSDDPRLRDLESVDMGPVEAAWAGLR